MIAMLAHPGGQGLGLPVWQRINDLVTLEVDQNGAVAVAAPPGPVIHAQRARDRRLQNRGAVDEPQQGVRAGRHREPLRQLGAGLAAKCQA